MRPRADMEKEGIVLERFDGDDAKLALCASSHVRKERLKSHP